MRDCLELNEGENEEGTTDRKKRQPHFAALIERTCEWRFNKDTASSMDPNTKKNQ